MDNVHDELKRKFWTQFISAKTQGHKNIYKDKRKKKKNGVGQDTEFSGVSVYVNLNLDKINVTLVVHSNSVEESNDIFNYLEQNSHEIQKHFPEKIFSKYLICLFTDLSELTPSQDKLHSNSSRFSTKP